MCVCVCVHACMYVCLSFCLSYSVYLCIVLAPLCLKIWLHSSLVKKNDCTNKVEVSQIEITAEPCSKYILSYKLFTTCKKVPSLELKIKFII